MKKKLKKLYLQYKKKIGIYEVLLFIIILTGIFFRFYNTPGRYSLGGDSSRDAIVAFVGAEQRQLPLTGPFSSAGQFTFGPWYYYQIILFTTITPFQYAPWIYMGLTSILYIYVSYLIGKNLYDKKLGLISAFFVSLSPAAIITGTALANPYLVPVFAGLTLLFYVYVQKTPRPIVKSLCLGLFLAIGINNHYQMLGFLWILPLVLLFKKSFRWATFLWTVVGFVVGFLPLLFFDLLNHWYTLKHVSHYYLSSEDRIYVPTRWLFYVRDFWPDLISQIIGVPLVISYLLIVLTILAGVYLWYKKLIKRELIVFVVLFFINFISLRYFWGERFLGYLQFEFPFVFLFFAFPFWLLTSKKVHYVGIILLVTLGFVISKQSIARLSTFPQDNLIQQEATFLRNKFPNSSIQIYNCDDHTWEQAQGVSLLLKMNGQASSKTQKIGFDQPSCLYPILGFDKTSSPSAEIIASQFKKIGNSDFIDLNSASEAALLDYGWKKYSPTLIYDSTLKWWYEEKP